MRRLGHGDYERVLDFIAETQEAAHADNFGAALVEVVKRFFPGVVPGYDQIHEARGLYVIDHGVDLSADAVTRYFARLQEVYQQNPIYNYIRDGGKEAVVDIGDLATRSRFERTDFYQDIFKPLGIKHQLVITMPREGWITTLTLNHETSFRVETVAMLKLLAPHIISAHRTACRLGELRAAAEGRPQQELKLTFREAEVFHWMREGKRNGEIAVILGCSTRTVEKHVENILRKTGAETRAAAVRAF